MQPVQLRTVFIVSFALILTFLSCTENRADTRKEPLSGKWSVAVFAGGCFWCMEPPFDKLDGVKETISGYTGGSHQNPTYDEVSYGKTDHVEAVLIRFDPSVITYEELLNVYWRTFNPMQSDGQFYDIGPQYKSAVFYLNESQKALAVKSKKELIRSGRFPKPVVTPVLPVTDFWRAEEYHQNYYKKNPDHYYRYRKGSGRDDFIRKYWPELNSSD